LKTEKDFIAGMWEKVSRMEYEEIQTKSAKIQNKKITITNTAITISIIFAFVLFIFTKPMLFTVYIISVLSLLFAYWLDKFLSGENEKKTKGAKWREN